MNWIQAYIDAIKTHLPAAKREDLGEELKALLEESLEADTGKNASQLSEAETLAWLKSREHPSLVAARYQERRCLIDEDSFPLFKLTLRYVLIGLALAYGALELLSWLSSGNGISLHDLAANIARAGLLAFAGLVIAFHYFGNCFNAKERLAKWNPNDLPDPDSKWEREPISSSLAGLVFTGIFFLLLNGLLGRAANYVGGPVEEAVALLPWINAVLIGSLLLYGALLLKPRWSVAMLSIDLALALAAAAIAFRLLQISPLVEGTLGSPESAGNLARLEPLGDLHLRAVVIIILAVSLYEAGRDLWRIARLARRRA